MSQAKIAVITPSAVARAVSSRRSLFGGAAAVVLGTGITAGVAASAADLLPSELEPDAALLSLRADLLAAVADVSWSEMNDVSDDRLAEIADRLRDVCWAIVKAPPAETASGRALKAAGAMHHLRAGFDFGEWPSCGEAMAWNVLSQLAGDVYAPPAMPERFRALCEPARA